MLGNSPFEGNLEPPGMSYQMAFGGDKCYKDEWWDPMLRAQLVLAEFATKSWRSATVEAPDNSDQNLGVQIEELLAKRAMRPRRNAEIVAQVNSFVDYWYGLLGVDSVSRPQTATMVQVGIAVGEMVVMYWKNVHKRIRPVLL